MSLGKMRICYSKLLLKNSDFPYVNTYTEIHPLNTHLELFARIVVLLRPSFRFLGGDRVHSHHCSHGVAVQIQVTGHRLWGRLHLNRPRVCEFSWGLWGLGFRDMAREPQTLNPKNVMRTPLNTPLSS